MDAIDFMRAISTFSLACWFGAAFVAIPLFWHRDVKHHPVLFLLFLVTLCFTLQSVAFVEAAFQLDKDVPYRVTQAVLVQRTTSILAAIAFVGVLRCVTHKV